MSRTDTGVLEKDEDRFATGGADGNAAGGAARGAAGGAASGVFCQWWRCCPVTNMLVTILS